MTDVERIAVLESQLAELKTQLKEMKATVDVLSEHCPDRNDLQRRFQAIHNAFRMLAPQERSLFEKIFGI